LSPKNVLTESAIWDQLADPTINQTKLIFHGTPTPKWRDSSFTWLDGFKLTNSLETRSQSSREKAIYFSNSLAHSLFSSAYRAGTCRFNQAFDEVSGTSIVVSIDLAKESASAIMEQSVCYNLEKRLKHSYRKTKGTLESILALHLHTTALTRHASVQKTSLPPVRNVRPTSYSAHFDVPTQSRSWLLANENTSAIRRLMPFASPRPEHSRP
jgi:hypothetical protein